MEPVATGGESRLTGRLDRYSPDNLRLNFFFLLRHSPLTLLWCLPMEPPADILLLFFLHVFSWRKESNSKGGPRDFPFSVAVYRLCFIFVLAVGFHLFTASFHTRLIVTSQKITGSDQFSSILNSTIYHFVLIRFSQKIILYITLVTLC
jgi:hypothetical protein